MDYVHDVIFKLFQNDVLSTLKITTQSPVLTRCVNNTIQREEVLFLIQNDSLNLWRQPV